MDILRNVGHLKKITTHSFSLSFVLTYIKHHEKSSKNRNELRDKYLKAKRRRTAEKW